MNQLTILTHEGIPVIDSLDIAMTLERPHRELISDIVFCDNITSKPHSLHGKPFEPFIRIKHAYERGDKRYTYLITEKGCDILAERLSGRWGELFRADYTTVFKQWRKQKAEEVKDALPKEIAALIEDGTVELLHHGIVQEYDIRAKFGAKPIQDDDVILIVHQKDTGTA